MSYAKAKRWMDLAGAGLGLVLLLPLGLVISLAIKLADRGPVFYSQLRVGQFAKPFRLLKFRSMAPGADQVGPQLTCGGDPRRTCVGRWLRRAKLDELPQLWNVLIGEMSLVGPRPEVPRYVQAYTPEQRDVLRHKPGITDPASVLFRNEEALLAGQPDVEQFYLRYCLPRKIQLNHQYASRATVLKDLWIIVRTICPDWVGVALLYAITLTAGLWLAQQLVFDLGVSSLQKASPGCLWPWVVLPQLALMFWVKQCHATLRSFGQTDLRQLVTALGLALCVQLALLLCRLGRLWPEAAILGMDASLSLATLCAVRWGLRQLWTPKHISGSPVRQTPGRLAIIGARALGAPCNPELASAQRSGRIVAIFDDDPRYWHKRVQGILVGGMPECLLSPHWVARVDQIIAALPREDGLRVEELRELFRHLPLLFHEINPNSSLALASLG